MRLKIGLRRSIYFLAVAVCAKLTFLATFSFTHPYLERLGDSVTAADHFTAHVWASGIAGLLLAALDLVVFSWALRRFPRLHNFISDGYSPVNGTLGYLLSRAEFAPGSGVCIKGDDGIILICNETMLRPFRLTQEQVLGRRVTDVFPPHIAAAFMQVENRARETRSAATLDLKRRDDVPDEGISAIRIVVTPIFYDETPSALAGYIILTRDITEIKLIEQAAFKSRMDYRHLMDNAPIAIEICRFLPSTGDNLPDFEVLETSAAGLPIVEETRLQGGISVFGQFPFLLKNQELLAVLRSIRDGGPPASLKLHWESIGKTFECHYASFGESSFTVMAIDITDSLQSEDQVLRLNDQLLRTRAEDSASMQALLGDYNTFMHAVVERVQEPLALLRNNTHHIPLNGKRAYQDATLELQNTMERMLRYANASMLPFTPGLLDLNITADQLIANLSRIHPGVSFHASPLPVLRTSEPVFRSLLGSLLSLVIDDRADQAIQLFAESRFMDTLICIGPIPRSCPVLGSMSDLDEYPEWTELGWDMSENLDLALARRLIAYHGGQLMFRSLGAGCTHIGFYLGAPLQYLTTKIS